jgi:hypothetical protein
MSQLPFEYIITLVNEEGEWRVLFNPVQSSISCSCRKFETFGILCCHALKVFEANDVKLVPEQYILKRWRRDARNGIIHDTRRNEVVEDPKLSITQRYRQLCSTMIRLAADVSICPTLYELADTAIHDLCKKVMEVRLKQNAMVNDEGGVNDEGDVPTLTTTLATTATGFEIRPGLKRQRRLTSWIERQRKTIRRAPTVQPSPCHQSRVYKFIVVMIFLSKKFFYCVLIFKFIEGY